MRVLLVNACPCQVDYPRTGQEPLGILYLAASLIAHGHEVRVLDYAVQPYSPKVLLTDVRAFAPSVIGLSFRSASFPMAVAMATLLHREFDLPILLGGQHASAAPEQVLQALPFAYVFRSEAEQSCPAFLKHFSGNILAPALLCDIPGLSYCVNGEVIHNPDSPLVTNLDILPHPARHLLNYERYTMSIEDKPAINLISSRGCPHRCYFCDKSISRSGSRFRSPQSIADEIETAARDLDRHAVYFVDDIFLLDRRRVYALFDELRARHIAITWRCLARVDSVEPQFLRDLVSFGCRKITFGVETGDAETLLRIGKRTTLEKAERAIAMAREVGIPAKANFVFGFPWETRESILQTIAFARRLDVEDEYDFFLATPYPGTPFWRECCRRNWLANDTAMTEKMTQYFALVPTEYLTREELQELLIQAYVDIFQMKWHKRVPVDGVTFVARHAGDALNTAISRLPFDVHNLYHKLHSIVHQPSFGVPLTAAELLLHTLDGTLPAMIVDRMKHAQEQPPCGESVCVR